MATSANLAPGAVPAGGSSDPFTTSPAHAQPTPARYGPFNGEQFSLYATNSPASAKRALEAHLKDTDRRIQDASRLGTTLVQQRRDLAARLKEVEQVQSDNEVPAALQERLTALEKEYNEVGRESARAFLPKARVVSEAGQDNTSNPTEFSAQSRESPSKMTAPSRKLRNQPNNRVHDIEFATEISTSLLAQVRQLQAALAEKDDALKVASASSAQFETDAVAMTQRIRHMDENEQKYKDENWNLETRLQELESTLKDTSEKHSRLAQTLVLAQSEKAAKERELDDLKANHERSADDYSTAKKAQEADLQGLRREAATYEAERQRLSRRVDELTMQNTELAKAVSSRWKQTATASDTDFVSADDGENSDDLAPEQNDPTSPVKGTPARHGMLESETLKSSLNHAHRMIQNLKNNIHREKTEKLELKRMLQDARDELESKRDTGVAANVARKRRNDTDQLRTKKSATRLGANRSATTEVVAGEPDWEDHDGEVTPSRPAVPPFATSTIAAAAAALGLGQTRQSVDETDTTDAFETANERDTAESEAFATGVEDLDDNSDGDATETETNAQRNGNVRGIRQVSNFTAERRLSLQSTASTSDDDDDEIIRTPVQSQMPKYRIRGGRPGRRSGRVTDLRAESPSSRSPASSLGTPQHPEGMQSLGDELDALDEGSIGGTPASVSTVDEDTLLASPETPSRSTGLMISPDTTNDIVSSSVTSESHAAPDVAPVTEEPLSNTAVLPPAPQPVRPVMVDAGVMTEPWQHVVHQPVVAAAPAAAPAAAVADVDTPEKPSLRDRAGDLVGGALAGFGLSRMVSRRRSSRGGDLLAQDQASAAASSEEQAPPVPKMPVTEHTEPSAGVATLTVPEKADTSVTKRDTMIAAGSGAAPIVPTQESITDPTGKSSEEQNAAVYEPQSSATTAEARESTLKTLLGQDDSNVKPAAAPRLGYSPVLAQEIEPVVLEELPSTLLPPPQSSQRIGAAVVGLEDPFTGPRESIKDEKLSEQDDKAQAIAAEPKSLVGVVESQPTAAPLPDDVDSTGDLKSAAVTTERVPLSNLSPNVKRDTTNGMLPTIKPLQIKKPMADEGSQTVVSGREIDAMLRNKSNVVPARDAGISPAKAAAFGVVGAAAGAASPIAASTRRSTDTVETGSPRAIRRPGSAGSTRSKVPATPPPLPADHTQKIAAAGAMGPPSMPASAYKNLRPKTPTDRLAERVSSRDGTTPRPARARDSRTLSARTSVSSFASELDDRFNIHRGQIAYPHDVEPATDPRMIQAITQTMIGEYLWKYTRKAGRSETSNTRHRRFFWVHPYTRTLYWSEQDPSTAGKNMLKAKSVAIDSVRVVTDDNAYPPGLHRKSLVVVTPGREIVFTAPTGQRHETWFNALSYLLLRTSQEKDEAGDTVPPVDARDSTPGIASSVRRSLSKMSARSRSRVSMSSYNSRATRTSSPHRQSLNASQRQRITETPTLVPSTGPQTPAAATGTAGSRFSTFASRLRASSTARGRSSVVAPLPDDPAQIYDASVVSDSAEDLRAVMARQELDADKVENVRACCDGKHDVGSLSHRHKHTSLGSRFSTHAHHSHSAKAEQEE